MYGQPTGDQTVPLDSEPTIDDTTSGPALGRMVGTSALWSALDAGLLRGSSFLISLVVARLVAPYYFGVFTVAITILNFALSFTELGVGSALVREHGRSRAIAPTVLTISLAGGAIIAVLMLVFAPFFARELGAANAAGAIRVLALIPLLSGLSVVPVALMSRDFMQKQRFFADCTFFVVATVVMLVLVLDGHPVMGLVWSQVAAQVVSIGVLMWMSPEKYAPGFDPDEARHLLKFGVPLAGSNLVTIAIANVDFIVVGHLLGARQLGYYNLAYNISSWPVTIFTGILTSVTLPTLSRVRDSPKDLTKHLTAGLSAIALTAFPVSALLAALASPLIDTMYGKRWQDASAALIVLSLFGAARTVLALFSDLAIALGMTRRLFGIQIVWLGALIPAMMLFVNRWGILGAGIAHAVVVCSMVIPIYVIMTARNTPVALRPLFLAIGRPLVASLGAAAGAYGIARFVNNDIARLLVGMACGLAVYALLAGRRVLEVGGQLHAMYWQRADGNMVERRSQAGPTPSAAECPLPPAAAVEGAHKGVCDPR